MVAIETYVFFDLETTGLPCQERNRTKVTELCFVAVSRKELENTQYGDKPLYKDLRFCFNPGRKIHPEVVKLTGLSNKSLRYSPKFREKIPDLILFLEEFPKPVCLVAHNGNRFDFKIIQNEFIDAQKSLPAHLLCVDSLLAFRKLLHNSDVNYLSLTKQEGLLTDDEDDEIWPDLNITPKDWDDIDQLSSSMLNTSLNDTRDIVSLDTGHNKVKMEEKKKVPDEKKEIKPFSLCNLYKRLLNKDPIDAHTAIGDCLMLLECVVAVKDFLNWADRECKSLSSIKPFVRH